MPTPTQYPVRVCPQANQEHYQSTRQYAHVFHRPGVICVARAFHRLPKGRRLALLLHEAGHLWAGPRGGEDAANRAAKEHSGVTVYYTCGGELGPELEWIKPGDYGKAARALGLDSGMRPNPAPLVPPATSGPKFDRWFDRLTDDQRTAYIRQVGAETDARRLVYDTERRRALGARYGGPGLRNPKADPPPPGWVKVKTLRDADGLYCPTCPRLWTISDATYWGFNKTKGMHEGGTGHRPYYVAMEKR